MTAFFTAFSFQGRAQHAAHLAARDRACKLGGSVGAPVEGGPGTKRNGLALGDLPGVEQVELDFPDDAGDAGLAWFPGGEVAGFP